MPVLCLYQRYLPPDPSGAGKQALTLARFLRGRNWDVVFLTDAPGHCPEPDPLREFRVMRVDPPPANPSYPAIARYWTRLGHALWRMRSAIDVVQVHAADFVHVGAAPLARLAGKPVVVRSSIAGEFRNLRTSLSGRAERLLLTSANEFVVISQELAAEFRAADMPPAKLNLVPNGVDTGVYHPVSAADRRALRRDLALPLEGNILVYHGVFIDRKSIHWMIELLEPHMNELDITLLLVGGPARDEPETGYAARLHAQVRNSAVRDRIIVRQSDPHIHRYLKAADAYVLPSTSEGLSNALLEALATGLVCIASRTSGSSDVIDDGASGLLFEPRNSEQFLDRIRAVFGASGTVDRAAMGGSAVETICRDYSMDATSDRYVGIYERLIGRPRQLPGQNRAR